MKALLLFMGCICVMHIARTQTCNGGVNFASAANWNPAWIGGCTNGTACTGSPMIMDTRPSACSSINTTSLDLCAPAPSCSGAGVTAADLWFKFYACSTSATIRVIQHVSFVATIQAFSSSSTSCSGLAEIGCAIAGGPSGGVTLNLTGLTPNKLYYFRVFGTAATLAQTTGAWCFCGSVGLCPPPVLPVQVLSFTLQSMPQGNKLLWRVADQVQFDRYEIEKSTNGIDFYKAGQVKAVYSSASETAYEFTDPSLGQPFYYRLKLIDENGHYDYSAVIKSGKGRNEFSAQFDPGQKTLTVHSVADGYITVHSVTGVLVKRMHVRAGISAVSLALAAGIYLVSDPLGNVRKIISYSN